MEYCMRYPNDCPNSVLVEDRTHNHMLNQSLRCLIESGWLQAERSIFVLIGITASAEARSAGLWRNCTFDTTQKRILARPSLRAARNTPRSLAASRQIANSHQLMVTARVRSYSCPSSSPSRRESIRLVIGYAA